MKTTIAMVFALFCTNLFAGAASDLNRGLKSGKVKLQNVRMSPWLMKIEERFDRKIDFNENTSYVYEAADEMFEECEFDGDFEDFEIDEIDYYVDWKKAVKRGKSIAYIGFLVVPITNWTNGELMTCLYPREIFAVDRKGRNITNSIKVDLRKYHSYY